MALSLSSSFPTPSQGNDRAKTLDHSVPLLQQFRDKQYCSQSMPFWYPTTTATKMLPRQAVFCHGIAKYCSYRDKQAINVTLPTQHSSIQQPGKGWGTPAKLPCSSSQIFTDPGALFWRSLQFVRFTFPTERSFPWKKCVVTTAPGRVSHKSVSGNLNSHVRLLGLGTHTDQRQTHVGWWQGML